MLTSVTATTRDILTGVVDKTLAFTMEDGSYVVKDISGLGPVKHDISTVDDAAEAGGAYLGAHGTKRNIVMRIGFDPNYAIETVDDLREAIYNMYSPGAGILDLAFATDNKGTYLIKGIVESCEPNLFTKDPELVISIICPEPYFTKDEAPTVFNVPNTEYFTVPFDGQIPVGVYFEFDVSYSPPYDNWFIEGNPTRPDVNFALSNFEFAVGDKFWISSVRGDRFAQHITTAPVVTDMMPYINGSLVGFKLYPGNNYFHFFRYEITTNATMTYQKVYGGM